MISTMLKGLKMLTKPEFPDVAHFRQALQIPEPTPELLEAEASQQKAAAELASASTRLKAAQQELADAADLGRTSKVSKAAAMAIAAEVDRLSQVAAQAEDSLSRIRDDRRTSVQVELAGAVEEFTDAIQRKSAELDALFALGASVGDSYHRGGHLKTPHVFATCSLLRNFMRPVRVVMARVR